jgi:hypothetical protein
MKDRIPSTNCIFMIDLYTLKQKFCSPVPTSTRHAIIARKLVELIGFLSNLRSFFFIFLIYEKIVPLETEQYHIEVRN